MSKRQRKVSTDSSVVGQITGKEDTKLIMKAVIFYRSKVSSLHTSIHVDSSCVDCLCCLREYWELRSGWMLKHNSKLSY